MFPTHSDQFTLEILLTMKKRLMERTAIGNERCKIGSNGREEHTKDNLNDIYGDPVGLSSSGPGIMAVAVDLLKRGEKRVVKGVCNL